MYWLVTAVLLSHLGATLTGAWRASQPRLQFTHSGKWQHVFPVFQLITLSVLYICRSAVLHTHIQVDGVTHNFSFLLPFFLSSSVNAHTL